MDRPDVMVILLPVLQPITGAEYQPKGAVCLHCKERGPCLIVRADDVDDDVVIGIEFGCAECGREWEWSYSDGVYTFVREVMQEV